MKRIFLEDNYLVIAEDLDITDDKYTLLNNVYIEKNGSLFLFYRLNDNRLIESIYFADILDGDGVAYESLALFTDLMTSKTGKPNSIDVNVQDSTSPDFSLYLAQKLDDVTVLAGVSIDDESIDVETTGVTPVVDNFLCLRDGNSFYQAEIMSVTPIAGNQYTLGISIPFDFAYTTSSGCELQNVNMNVDGSSTPIEFALKAGGLDLFAFDITRITIGMVLSTAGDDGLFGNIAKLGNGVYFRTVNGTQKNLFNARINSDFAEEAAGDVTYTIRSGGQGEFGLRGRITFNGDDKRGVVIRLVAETNDSLISVVRDPLQTINRFRVKAQGHIAIN